MVKSLYDQLLRSWFHFKNGVKTLLHLSQQQNLHLF